MISKPSLSWCSIKLLNLTCSLCTRVIEHRNGAGASSSSTISVSISSILTSSAAMILSMVSIPPKSDIPPRSLPAGSTVSPSSKFCDGLMELAYPSLLWLIICMAKYIMPRPRPRRTATKKGASGTVRLPPAEDPSFLVCAPLVCGRFHSRIFESGWSDVFGEIPPNILLRERTRERTRSPAPSPLQAAGRPPREASRLESLERACLHLSAPGAAPPVSPRSASVASRQISFSF